MTFKHLSLAWQFDSEGIACAYYDYGYGAGNDVALRIDDALLNTSDKPIRAACVEITQSQAGNRSINSASYAIISIDNVPYKVYGRFRKTFTTEKLITINSIECSDLSFVFYSQPVFDLNYAELFGIATASTEVAISEYVANISNSGSIWIWDFSGTYPFNTGADVTIPIRLRVANPNRKTAFAIYGLVNSVIQSFSDNASNGVSGLALFWGTSQDSQEIPMICGYNDVLNGSNPQTAYYLDEHRPRTCNNYKWGSNFTAPFLCVQIDRLRRPALEEWFSDLLLTDEIWVVCKPSIATAGHAGIYTGNVRLSVS